MLIEACALYFPLEKLPLKSVFPQGRSDGGLLRPPTWFEYDSGDGLVRLNLRHENLEKHLRGFRGYVAQLPDDGAARAEAQRLIQRTKAAVGVILPRPVTPDSRVFSSLLTLLERFDGFMFVSDSILLPDGSFLVGPMADEAVTMGPPPVPPARAVDPEEFRHKGSTEGCDPSRVAQREGNYRSLAERGFRCALWMPLHRAEDHADRLRPIEEIAARLLALEALFLWVAAPENVADSRRLQAFVLRNALRNHLTGEENDILSLPRAEARETHAGTIGWRLENMWPLAWILGFEPAPPFFQGQLPQDVIDRMLFEFLPNLDATTSGFLAATKPRPTAVIAALEDLYYCAHNAVRSAQTGADTVPQEFHPVRDGGAVHERRHSLTWALSPDVAWDDTDLST